MTYCGAKTRKGTPCRRPAGWGTDHVGTGKCKLHGGASTGPPIKTGRYSLRHRRKLQAKIGQFLDDPAPGDLTSELALMRALLQDYLERFPDGQRLSLERIGDIYGMVESIGRLVERISKILNATALTQAEVGFLVARFTDLMSTYIDDPNKMGKFLDDLRATTGLSRLVGSTIIRANADEQRSIVESTTRTTD